METKEDWYSILGVSSTATKREISVAFKRLAKKYHPDKTGSNKEAAAAFEKIRKARDILGDDESRTNYDKERISAKGMHPFILSLFFS